MEELRDAIQTAADVLAQALALLPAPKPPAVAADKSAMLSVRMTESTLEALAARALEHGTTQRRIIAEALAKYGVVVAARDLEDRPQPRRRGRPRAA